MNEVLPEVILDGKGVITLVTNGLQATDVARLHRIITNVILSGVLTVRNSQMTLHFDKVGELDGVDILRKWRRSNPQLNSTMG
jgi:hypothetical protein